MNSVPSPGRCRVCWKGQTIEHNGRAWCPNCSSFVETIVHQIQLLFARVRLLENGDAITLELSQILESNIPLFDRLSSKECDTAAAILLSVEQLAALTNDHLLIASLTRDLIRISADLSEYREREALLRIISKAYRRAKWFKGSTFIERLVRRRIVARAVRRLNEIMVAYRQRVANRRYYIVAD